MTDELLSLVTPKFRGWKWIRLPSGHKARNVRIVDEGGVSRLHFEGDFSETDVRQAALTTLRRDKQIRSEAAKKAALVRQIRVEQKVHLIAKLYIANRLHPSCVCGLCGRELEDNSSIQRGVGTECWQRVLQKVEMLTSQIGKQSV